MKLSDARTYLFLGGILLGFALIGYAQHYLEMESVREAFRKVPTDVMQQLRDNLRGQEPIE